MRACVASLLAVVVLAVGCNSMVIEGSGNVVSETRDVNGFRSVSLAGTGELVVSQTGVEGLTVIADDNLLGHITTRVNDGQLAIGFESGASLRPSVPIRYELSVSDIDALAVSGSASVSADSLYSAVMNIAVSGSGGVAIRALESGPLSVAISGSGDVSLGGRVDSQSVAVSGSGECGCGLLESKYASVAVSGSGSVVLWVVERLDAQVSGSGSVEYYGEPVVEKRVSGSGGVRSLGPRKISI